MQATYAATLFDEWCHRGLTDAVICPGSRSTPLALAAADRAELTCHVRLDERSAGFFALGRALVTGRPVAIVVTSGTAAAELHAVVAEADLAGAPLLVLTADRPPELHGVGAPQTIDQAHLYGSMVRRFEDPGVARPEAAPTWRALAARLWESARGGAGVAGPAHLNAAFIEPLVASPGALPARDDDVVAAYATPATPVDVAGRVLCVVGHGVDDEVVALALAHDWVVIGDATSRGTVAHFDPLLRDERFVVEARPDVVVRLGGLAASKVLNEQLRRWRVRTVAFTGAGPVADPDRLVTETHPGLPDWELTPRGDAAYAVWWRETAQRVERWLDEEDERLEELTEPVVARLVVKSANAENVALVVGSSMPVRDVEWWAPPRLSPTYSNRGANGIDGVTSTALGVAAGGRALGLVGDVTLLHDVSGLVDGLGEAGGRLVLVVVDNRGGGIFSFLSQATALEPSRFERLFGTPRPHDLVAVATAFGHDARRVRTRRDLVAAIAEGLGRDGVSVVVAQVGPREENVAVHDAMNRAVAEVAERAT